MMLTICIQVGGLTPQQHTMLSSLEDLNGISKVGSYSGTGSDVDVDCGFGNGARFVMIKRSDGSGDFYIWDSLRGITSGNDPYWSFNLNTESNY